MKAFLVSLLVVTLAFADNWAILVAGSNGIGRLVRLMHRLLELPTPG